MFAGISLAFNSFGSNLAFSCDGGHIATGDIDDVIRQWLVPRDVRHYVRFKEGHTKLVHDICFSRDKLLASASADGTVRLWSLDPPHMPNFFVATDFV